MPNFTSRINQKNVVGFGRTTVNNTNPYQLIKRNNKKEVMDHLASHLMSLQQRVSEQKEQEERFRVNKIEKQMQMQLGKEKEEIQKKLKRAMEENTKIKVEH